VARSRPTTRLTGHQRRGRILDAALDEFAAGGYHETSMREIAAAAGITKPVLYLHFESKEALFVALLEEISGELTARGAAALATDAPPEARVRAAVEAFFAFVEERPAAARLLLLVPGGAPEALEASRRVQQGVSSRLAALLEAEDDLLASAPDRRRRLELFAELAKQGLHGLAEWWAFHPDVPRTVLVEAAMDVLWAGLRAHFDAGAPATGASAPSGPPSPTPAG
jgi:AcrR family transcriptional regulator